MSNVHSPERQPDESREDYKARRAQSKLLTKIITGRIGGPTLFVQHQPNGGVKGRIGRTMVLS